jgi:hypothetical protein
MSSKSSATLTLKYCVAINVKYDDINCDKRTLIHLNLERDRAMRANAWKPNQITRLFEHSHETLNLRNLVAKV